MAVVMASIRIVAPSLSGDNIISDIRDKDVNIIIRIFILYKRELNPFYRLQRSVCAVHYNIMIFINKCIDIDKFTLHQQSVSIRLLLRNQSGELMSIDV